MYHKFNSFEFTYINYIYEYIYWLKKLIYILTAYMITFYTMTYYYPEMDLDRVFE